jgi:hypothetical protein
MQEIDGMNVTLEAFRIAWNRAKQEDKITADYWAKDSGVIYADLSDNDMDLQVNPTSVTLVNGTTVGASRFEAYQPSSAGGELYATGSIRKTTDSKSSNIQILAPDGSGKEDRYIIAWNKWNKLWNRTDKIGKQMAENAERFADSAYLAYQNGEVTLSEIAGATGLAADFGTGWKQTGNWQYLITALQSMGLESPTLNTSYMRVSVNNSSYKGLVMSQTPPDSGSWQTGVSYNGSNISGLQILITTDAQKINLEGKEFTISKMVNRNGEEISSAETKEYNYVETDTSNLSSLNNDLLGLRNQIERLEDQIGAGGGGSADTSEDSGLNLSPSQLLIVGAVAAALVGLSILTRRQ